MIKGLVSTIIPVFNRAQMLSEAVESVLQQDYANIEIIVVDDGSTDNSLAVAKSLEEKHKTIRVISIENAGPGAAREAGQKIARGEFIQYLDSDDLLKPNKFTLQVQGLNENPEYGISYCKTGIMNEAGDEVTNAWKRTGESIKTLLPSMLAGRWWGTSTPLYRSSLTSLNGAWKTWINEEDWEYDCRLAALNPERNIRLHYVPQTLSIERHHSASRLSDHGGTEPKKLHARALAHEEVINHAITAGQICNTPEYIHLLKATFLLSRQCGAAGEAAVSKKLFGLAKFHLDDCNENSIQLELYKFSASIFGWLMMGKFSSWLDSFRKR